MLTDKTRRINGCMEFGSNGVLEYKDGPTLSFHNSTLHYSIVPPIRFSIRQYGLLAITSGSVGTPEGSVEHDEQWRCASE
ncbi:MAG: hypothetical protein HY960_01965 [Ignavibacteriae bacterium]|nr:hypothetical protein [Ignavibacteriota bacterium]